MTPHYSLRLSFHIRVVNQETKKNDDDLPMGE